jgi:hypothetical protein
MGNGGGGTAVWLWPQCAAVAADALGEDILLNYLVNLTCISDSMCVVLELVCKSRTTWQPYHVVPEIIRQKWGCLYVTILSSTTF